LIGIFTKITSPLQSSLTSAGTAITSLKSKAELVKENEELNKKLEQLSLDVSQLKTLEVENQVLREQLNFVEGQGYKFVTGRIISRSSQNSISTLVINRGSQDGIRISCPVVAGEGVLVGKIIEVGDHSATLLLLTDSQSRVAATIQNKDQTIGVVEGEHGISLKMAMIPQNEEIKIGETIITSGLQENIPRGLLVGLIDKIDSASSELFSQAYVYPLVDYQKLNIVTILIP
jgi:rod shape-determining protein MreC